MSSIYEVREVGQICRYDVSRAVNLMAGVVVYDMHNPDLSEKERDHAMCCFALMSILAHDNNSGSGWEYRDFMARRLIYAGEGADNASMIAERMLRSSRYVSGLLFVDKDDPEHGLRANNTFERQLNEQAFVLSILREFGQQPTP